MTPGPGPGTLGAMRLADLTFPEAQAAWRAGAVGILPVGATEAHGPHLPLNTDVIIAEAMAREGARRLEARGIRALVLPSIAYSVAEYAGGFAGTVSISPETASAVLLDIAKALSRQGARALAIANAHLEPAHIASLTAAVDRIRQEKLLPVAFPDVTRKPWALRLTEEFLSGACHAGRYESSLVMAERPDLVREEIRKRLAPNPASLSTAIREGRRTFAEAGGPEAYFGWPADATAEEGRRTAEILGGILEEAVTTALNP